MTYDEAEGYIHALHMFSKKDGLTQMTRLMNMLGNPQNSLKFVHITGTNGKGSTTAMTSFALKEAGYKTGMFISPFVINFRERMQINGHMISEDDLIVYTEQVKKCADIMLCENCCPTEFEVVTAIAMLYFASQKCDIVVLEVGLGGRLDPTNIISTTIVSAICAISLDHTNLLGATVELIATEKCGILRRNIPCVCYPVQNPAALAVIMEKAAALGAPVVIGGRSSAIITQRGIDGSQMEYKGLNIRIPLIGEHQVCNCINAVEILLQLKSMGYNLPDDKIAAGIAKTFFPARTEIICKNPLVIVDGAHNNAGAEVLSAALGLLNGRRITAIIGMLGDKDVAGSIGHILPLCTRAFAVSPHNHRAMSAERLTEIGLEFCSDITPMEDDSQAFTAAFECLRGDDVLLICGSLYLASDMRIIARNYFEKNGIAHSESL